MEGGAHPKHTYIPPLVEPATGWAPAQPLHASFLPSWARLQPRRKPIKPNHLMTESFNTGNHFLLAICSSQNSGLLNKVNMDSRCLFALWDFFKNLYQIPSNLQYSLDSPPPTTTQALYLTSNSALYLNLYWFHRTKSSPVGSSE